MWFIALFILGGALLFVSLWASLAHRQFEGLSIQECGFDPFSDARFKFDLLTWLIALLFLLFDLELVFLFPLTSLLLELSWGGWLTFQLLFTVITLGFLVELRSATLVL